jgi:hypothetical protein
MSDSYTRTHRDSHGRIVYKGHVQRVTTGNFSTAWVTDGHDLQLLSPLTRSTRELAQKAADDHVKNVLNHQCISGSCTDWATATT